MRVLLGVPAYSALVASGVLVTFAAISFITWGPDYVVRFKGFSMREAGISLGAVGFASLLLGVLAGGTIADLLQKRYVHGRVVAIASGFLLATPFILWALATENKQHVLAAFFLASFFMSWYHGPVTAVIHDMMPRRAHATSVGLYMFVTQLVGGTLAPVLVGALDDRHTLQIGLLVAVAVMVLGALSLFLVVHFIRRDGLRHTSLDVYRAQHEET
jgi:sugar phosphate permease